MATAYQVDGRRQTADGVRSVRPVVQQAVRIEEMNLGEWCLYRGNFYLCLGGGLLAGPVGSLGVRPQGGELVQRVEMAAL